MDWPGLDNELDDLSKKRLPIGRVGYLENESVELVPEG